MPLTVVATIRAKHDKAGLVEDALQNLVEPTRAEEGCINYDLHRDVQDIGHFMFYEVWQSWELWQKHMASEHIKVYLQATEGAVAEFSVSEMQQVA